MAERVIGPAELTRCLFSSAEYLEQNHDILNNLNVFPVPDGDTGTNMLSTFEAGIRVLKSGDAGTMKDIAGLMNAELTRHSRGNSGFIIARFFHGFFEVVGRHSSLGREEMAAGFGAGLFQVNSSLFSPVEGTMITIIRAMTEELKSSNGDALSVCLGRALETARRALKETPRLLPVLAKAGVVDSGALGFIFLMEGFCCALTDKAVVREKESDYRFPPDSSGADSLVDTRVFGYCTEITVLRPREIPRGPLSEYLEERGNSIALVREDDFLKIHIHTDKPAEIIEYMKTLGTVEHVKIDNLVEQISRFSTVEHPDEGCTVFAFIPGEGFREIFRSLGVNDCMLYTEHLPSTGEILEHLEAIHGKNIIVLPNNKNILPAVMMAADKSQKHLAVIHTNNIIQGLAASYGYSGNDGIDDNVVNMKDCKDLAEGIFIYKSEAVSEFDGQVISPGDYFALVKGTLGAVGKDLAEVALESMKKTGLDEASNAAFYYRDQDVKNALGDLDRTLAEGYENLEVEFFEAGQFRESLIISLE